MSYTKKPATWWETLEAEKQLRIKQMKKAKFRLKAKLFLTLVLPVFVVLLSVRVIQTFLRMKAREIFSQPKVHEAAERKTRKPVPAQTEPVEKEIIKPEPVSGRTTE